MTFLTWPTEQVIPSQRAQAYRRRVASALVERFARAFPEITYQFVWEAQSLNAQAWMFGSKPCVRLYGGLVRHRSMGKCGLALTLAHETGHHLGGSPRDPDMGWMTWQGQADYWAAQTGMPLVFGAEALRVTLRGARELIAFHQELIQLLDGDEPDLSSACRDRIFRAGAANGEMPSCAKREFRECFGRDYPGP